MKERFNEQVEDMGEKLFEQDSNSDDFQAHFNALDDEKQAKLVEVCKECIHCD